MEHLCNSTVKDCNRRCFSSNGIVGLANIGVFVSHLDTGYIIKVTVLFLLSMWSNLNLKQVIWNAVQLQSQLLFSPPHLSLMFVGRLVSVCSLAEAQSYLDSVVILLLTVTEISAEWISRQGNPPKVNPKPQSFAGVRHSIEVSISLLCEQTWHEPKLELYWKIEWEFDVKLPTSSYRHRVTIFLNVQMF